LAERETTKMLTALTIRDLGLIRFAELELSPGLNCISGETGAGKSLLLSAVGLLSGQKGDGSRVAAGASELRVESFWQLPPNLSEDLLPPGPIEDPSEDFPICRKVLPTGRSRAYVGGESSTAKKLSEIAPELIEIHGQGDQGKLRDPIQQLSMVDRLGGESLTEAFASYQRAHEAWLEAKRTLEDVEKNSAAARREIRVLRKLLEDIEELQPQAGELEELEEAEERLTNMELIGEKLVTAQNWLESDEYSLEAAISSALEELRSLPGGAPQELLNTGEEALQLVDALTKGIQLQIDELEGDDLEELAAIQSRATELKALLKRSSMDSLEDLLEEEEIARSRLQELSAFEEPKEQLEEALEAAHEELLSRGALLTKSRKSAARKLEKAVNGELSALAMGGSTFRVVFGEEKIGALGLDSVGFMLQQRGQQPAPIAKAASGGELSRISLAIELSLAAAGSAAKTFVFDEVDAGIGGSTALEVGKRLAKLAQTNQVIVVSHLAQVVSYADRSFRVSKDSNGATVETTVALLNADEQATELARMLAGMEDSSSAREHAQELLAAAKIFKENTGKKA